MNITKESLSQTDLVLKDAIKQTLPIFLANHWGKYMDELHPEFGVNTNTSYSESSTNIHEDTQFLIDSIKEQLDQPLLDKLLQDYFDSDAYTMIRKEEERWHWNRKGKVEETVGGDVFYSEKDAHDFELLFKKAILEL